LTATESDSYFWTPNGETTQSITVTEPGDYGVSITDENGCSNQSQTVSITIYTTETVVISTSGSLKFCDGEDVTLTASAGDTYTWYPNGETDQSIVVSDSGQYVVTVIDANGCSSTSDTANVIVIPNPEPIIIADGPTGFCDGETVILSSSIVGGNVWSPNAEETDSITVGESGDYFVTTTDKDGCIGESNVITVTVFDTPTPTITASGSTEICENDSVILTSSIADSYLWTPNGETDQSITVYQSGTYSVTVVDANGCEGEALTAVEITVFETEPVSVSVNGPLEFCDGGEVILTSSVSDSYTWSPNGETSQSITATESGEYVVSVTDANGCEIVSDTVEVVVFDLPEPIVVLSGSATFCEDDSLTLTAPISDVYLWYPHGQTTQSITVFEEGSYAVQVADANTCVNTSDTVDVTVFVATEIEITADGVTEFCADDEVVLTATSGQSYEWSPNGEQTQEITVTESGQYVVSVTDANGCSYDSDTLNVEVFNLPIVSVDVTGDLVFCEGETVDLTAVSPDAVTYQWLENGASINGASSESITVGDSSLYTVTVTDGNGCTASDDAPIMTVGPAPVAVVPEDQWMCAYEDVTLIASGGDDYVWSNGETGSTITVAPDSAMYYTVTVTNEFCSFTSSDSALVSLYPSPIAEIKTNPSGILEVNHDFTDVSGDSSIVYWEWNYGDGDFEEEQHPDHMYGSEEFFTVILTVENEFGCIDTDTAEVEITQVIDIPNVFTPDDDGINDFIFIDNFGVDEYEFTIYNRWGLVMHYDASTEISWDGRTPAGAEADAGTYYYVLNVLNPHSEGNFNQTGTITLIR
jgi:gliding motility-associated-like protein